MEPKGPSSGGDRRLDFNAKGELVYKDSGEPVDSNQHEPGHIIKPTAEESRKKEKKIFKAAVINTTALMEAQARDVGDGKMTESKEDRSKGFLKRTWGRIWKHNLAQEYYRQKEIAKARNEILETGNLYAGEKEAADSKESSQAMDAIITRFTSEYRDEMLTREEKDSIQEEKITSSEINDLIRKYADPAAPMMSDEAFRAERDRIVSKLDPTYGKRGMMHADNLFDIAKEVRQSIAEGQKMEDLDFDVEITLGKAKGSLKTEAHHNTFDNLMEKAQNSKFGKYAVNVPGALALYGGLYSGLKQLGMKVARNDAVKLMTFGGSAVIAGSMAAAKEAARLNRERSQHMRESAKGMIFDEKDMVRRQQMEKNRYETKNAKDITAKLQQDMEKVAAGNLSVEAVQGIMANIADMEARIELGDTRQIDLVTYSRYSEVEKERTQLDLVRAQLKVALKKGVEAKMFDIGEPTDFDTYLSHLTYAQSRALVGGESGIDRKDRTYNLMKVGKTGAAFLKAAVIGATYGALLQEVGSLVMPELQGVIGGAIEHFSHHGAGENLGHHATALEALRRHLTTGETTRVPEGVGHEVLVNGTEMHLPDGTDIVKNPDGTYNIMRGSDVVSKNVPLEFESNGQLKPVSSDILKRDGIFLSFNQTVEHGEGPMSAEDYIMKHPGGTTSIHRELWYDNDTPHPFDQNELKETWGGVKGTGMDEHGNYVFRMSGMTHDGSYHGGEGLDVPDAIKNTSGMKMLFSLSKGTQHQVFEVPIDAHGNAIIDKDSELAKLMFAADAHGHAVFKGQFAEVAESMGKATDGAENVRIVATHIGLGQTDIVQGPADKIVPNIKLDIPDTWDWETPYILPVGRRPLEEGRNPEKTKDKVPAKNAEEIPAGGFRTPGTPAPIVVDPGMMHGEKKLSVEQHKALVDDLKLINARIQGHSGIITLSESELKSELGKKMYRGLKNIPDGKNLTFNKSELAAIGDALERELSGSTVEKNDKKNRLLEQSTFAVKRFKKNESLEDLVSDEDLSKYTLEKKVPLTVAQAIADKVTKGETLTQNEQAVQQIFLDADKAARAQKKATQPAQPGAATSVETVTPAERDALTADLENLRAATENLKLTNLKLNRGDIKSKAALDLLLKIRDIPAGKKKVSFSAAEIAQVEKQLKDMAAKNGRPRPPLVGKKFDAQEFLANAQNQKKTSPKTVKETISDEDFKTFEDDGTVSPELLVSIANKIKDGKNDEMTTREISIYKANNAKIENLLQGMEVVETFLKNDLPNLIAETLKNGKYDNIQLPKDALSNLKVNTGDNNVVLSGDMKLFTKGKSGKFNESTIHDFQVTYDEADNKMGLSDEYTFIDKDDILGTRAQVGRLMKEIGDKLEAVTVVARKL